MPKTVAEKLLSAHTDAPLERGREIPLAVDQTLTQDATGTLVMLELEAMEVDRVQTELSVQYVDHNLIQADFKNPDDHLFLESACRRFGVWYSRPGNGVSHPVHMQHFGAPGKTLLGSDSHTCAAGALGMLAMGSGGVEVALAMAGEPYYLKVPEIWGVRLEGELPPWVSAKDVILEMLRRHGVRGGKNRIVEYHGPGVRQLDVWDRHTIANMGQELGATTTVWPADDRAEAFLAAHRRSQDFRRIEADEGVRYDVEETIDLSSLVPLIAKPSSPGNVVPVEEVAGEELYQAYIGSSANPGPRDFGVPALMVKGRPVDPRVSFDVNPTSRALLEDLMRQDLVRHLVHAGARLHQAGCNGCIGMGQAPATGRNSLRTVPRNFPGRSGTPEDAVFLCSPETATASALRGVITDPRDLDFAPPRYEPLPDPTVDRSMFVAPLPPDEAREVKLSKGPNVRSFPEVEPPPDTLRVPVILTVGDDVSTDEILPAGANVLPLRSNIPEISRFVFRPIDPEYPARADEAESGHALVAGENYGQGSSREHAALAPRHLGLRVVLARSFSRIHGQNLVNFGVLPLTIEDGLPDLARGDTLAIEGLHHALAEGAPVEVSIGGRSVTARHELSARQIEVLLAGGIVPWMRERAPTP